MFNRLRGMRLRNRILIWSFVPSTIILFAVAVTIYFAYQSVTEDLVVGRNQQLIHLSAGQLSADINRYADTLTTLTRTADMYSGDPARQAKELERAANQLLVFDGGALVLDPPGNVVVEAPESLGFLGQDWSNRSFYRQIMHTGAPVFSNIISSRQGDRDVIAVAVPILDASGEFQGTLVGLFRVGASSYSAFYGGIIKLRLGSSGNTYLVDSTGRVVYHPDESRIGSDMHSLPAVQQVVERQVGYLRTRDLNGKDILATYAPVPGTPWGLINEEGWSDLLVSSRGYGQFLYLLLGLGVVIPTLVVTYGVRRITDPISKLIAAAKEIAEGKYGQQITVKTGDELEELVTQFNRMSSQLQESYTQLEQRVAARTKELATLNAIAAVASRSLDLTEILDDALPETVTALEMDCGAAYVLDDQGIHLYPIAQSGFSKQASSQENNWELQGSVIEQAALAGKPLVWQKDDCPEMPLKNRFIQAGMEQVICVPLMVKSKLVGAFILAGRASRPVSQEETSLLESVGQQIGVAVENAHLYEQAAEMAALSERNRLARDLHDAVTQTLFSASLVAEVLPRLWERDADVGRQKLSELHLLIRGALSEMRTLLLELRPDTLGDVDLADLYRHLTNAFTGRTRIPVTITQEVQLAPPPNVKEAFYRIAQEALNNIAKHSGATQVEIKLAAQEERLEVTIRDNGCGFDVTALSPENLGLKIMRERAEAVNAKLEIESAPNAGTQIKIYWGVWKENN